MKIFFGAFTLVALAACMAPLVLQPAEGPGTPYPCGYTGVSCAGHMCCPQSHVCGGTPFSGCPAGQCCFEGDGYHPPDAGAQPMTPERPE